MANMTPLEPITEGQIGKLNQNLSAKLNKHKGEIPSNLFQQLLGSDSLIDEIFACIRKRVDAISDLIVRSVKVNRNRSAQEALKATGRTQYGDNDVIKDMPNAKSEEVEVFFFKLGRYVNDNDLDKEYELRGLKPSDPFSLSAVNEADPAFADEYPNGTHWKDKGGKWCCAVFYRGDSERRLRVGWHDVGWGDDWWFAGVRK